MGEVLIRSRNDEMRSSIDRSDLATVFPADHRSTADFCRSCQVLYYSTPVDSSICHMRCFTTG
jgi:hypothetical protein